MKTTTRVQLELPEKSMARLTDLKKTTEAASYSEVLKNALRLYEGIINEYASGSKIYIKEENGDFREYKIFF